MLGLKLNHVIKGQPRKSIGSMTAQTVAIGGIGPMTAHEGANCNSGWILKTQRPSWRQCPLPNWFAINDIHFKTDFLPNHVHNTNHTKWVFIMHTNVDSLFILKIDAVQFHNNLVNFLQNGLKRHLNGLPVSLVIWKVLHVLKSGYIIHLSLSCIMRFKSARVVTALKCI